MRADDLQGAVGRVAGILDSTGIRPAIGLFRAARGEERTQAAARLAHAGALISQRFQDCDAVERRVIRSLHLDALASAGYWQDIVGTDEAARGEIVRLAARLMFAAQNLPGLTALLSDVVPPGHLAPLGSGEARLRVRLVDAGERASSPDRIARAIDGIDMLYSACASIARRPAMDLRLDAIDGTTSRDAHFTGGRDAIAAVVAVMTSVPDALQAIDEGNDIDLDALVASLPVFADLQTLASMGSFSAQDLSNISETMRQGALLVLESGIVLVPDAPAPRPGAAMGDPAKGAPDPRAVVADRHYDAYLREREAMRTGGDAIGRPDGAASNEPRSNGPRPDEPATHEAKPGMSSSGELARARLGTTMEEDRAHRSTEVERLLSALKEQRGNR